MPDLQHLRIVFGGHLGSLSNLEIPTQLAFSSNSLLTLKLMNQELDFAAISSFLLSDTNDFQRLRTLAIEISEFTPVVLDLLAERLVSLHNLELTTQFFQPIARNFMVGLNDISRIQMASVYRSENFYLLLILLLLSFALRCEVVTIGHGCSKICTWSAWTETGTPAFVTPQFRRQSV